MTGFDTGAHGAGGVDHLDACFPLGPHDQMVLEEPAEHLTAVALETLLEHTVLQHHRLIGAQDKTTCSKCSRDEAKASLSSWLIGPGPCGEPAPGPPGPRARPGPRLRVR